MHVVNLTGKPLTPVDMVMTLHLDLGYTAFATAYGTAIH